MNRLRTPLAAFSLGLMILQAGCGMYQSRQLASDAELDHYRSVATHIEYPDLDAPSADQIDQTMSPEEVGKEAAIQYWDLKLEEAFQIALERSKVMRDLGGLVLRAPNSIATVQTPALQDTDPRFGIDAALSQFDALFSLNAVGQKNDRALNNLFLGGGTRLLRQDTFVMQTALSKHTATGATFTLRHNTDYDDNNAPNNLFRSVWNTNFETEVRQPVLRGAGIEYNRIAGPNGVPGLVNGVLVARVNGDISLADFEIGMRDFVSNIENAYWDLYFAYRDLDAKVVARDAALDSWRRVHTLNVKERRGGEAEKEADAREQYFRFQEEVQNAWNGRLLDATRTLNGSSGGTFRAIGGVRVAERRLRLLLGLPISDGRLIRPGDEPKMAKISFDWEGIINESLIRRGELRRQRWVVKRRELELIASRNFLKPNLDVVGLYRWRGFGQDLLEVESKPDPFDNAYQNLLTGKFQEWQLGLEFSAPLGARLGHAAVRNAELALSREKTLLAEQERLVVHDLSNAVGDVDRAYETAQTNFNRRIAARQKLDAVQTSYKNEKAQLDQVLDAQRRLADAEIHYFSSLVEYELAIKIVHYEKGSLLDYNQVYLAEGPWPGKAYDDAQRRQDLAAPPGILDYVLRRPHTVSQGPVSQQTLPLPDEQAAPAAGESLPAPPEILPSPERLPGVMH